MLCLCQGTPFHPFRACQERLARLINYLYVRHVLVLLIEQYSILVAPLSNNYHLVLILQIHLLDLKFSQEREPHCVSSNAESTKQ